MRLAAAPARGRLLLGNGQFTAAVETFRNNLAAACRATGDLERAPALITTVLEQRTRILGPDHLDALSSRGGLARVCEASGELDRAVALYESTLTRLTELAGAHRSVTSVVAGLLTEALCKEDQDGPQP